MSRSPKIHKSSSSMDQTDANDKYTFLKQIGRGSYGAVWLVSPKSSSSSKSSKKQYVLKRLELRQSGNTLSQMEIDRAQSEAKLLSTLTHPNIVTYIESFCSSDGYLNIVMSYCEGGDLFTKLKEKQLKKQPLTENQIIDWLIQICMALQYLHDKNILHRDLKTQNIFLTKNDIVKIGDLGIARRLGQENNMATTMIGTPPYMSPEIFSHIPYGPKSDIWSLGCCAYEMATLEPAFTAADMFSLASKVMHAETPEMPKKYSNSLTNIIASMLKKNPDDRPTAKNILQDDFIKRHIRRLIEKTQNTDQDRMNFNSQSKRSLPCMASSSSLSHPTNVSINPSSTKDRSLIDNDYEDDNSVFLPLPSSHKWLPSPTDTNRSATLVHGLQPNELEASNSRSRRRLQACGSGRSSMNDQEKDLNSTSNLQQTDTLQRRKHDQQPDHHIKEYQQSSSSDEEDKSSIQSSYDGISRSKLGSISTARRRRREHRLHSSSHELPRTTSQENFIEDMKEKKEAGKDTSDLISMLTSTLQLPSRNIASSSRLALHNYDDDRPVAENRYTQRKLQSSSIQTLYRPLHTTNRLYQRSQELRENCLRDISPQRLQRILKILDYVNETQMMQEIMRELGDHLYHKYSRDIFTLKFYEDNLSKY